jgi:UDP-glucose 4-epimerase
MRTSKRVLVTGGAGFIGSHVVERFLAEGHAVVVLDDLSTGKMTNLPSGIDCRIEKVQSSAAREIIRDGKFDVIVHLAAQMDVRVSVADPLRDADINIIGVLNVLEAVRAQPEAARPRIVFSSTGGALYGESMEYPTTESAPTNPDSPYGVAKLATEYYLAYYGRMWGIESMALRFGNVYGPRQDPHGEAGVIAIFTERLLAGRPITIYGSGEQTRDYIYVTDVADAIHAAAFAPIPAAGPLEARAVNVGTGVETSVLELARLLAEVIGVRSTPEFAPERRGEASRSLLSSEKAASVLGWRARIGLADGLARTASWARSLGGALTSSS